jgi:hypothetical protein
LDVGAFTLGGFVQFTWTNWAAGCAVDHFAELFGVTSGLFAFVNDYGRTEVFAGVRAKGASLVRAAG